MKKKKIWSTITRITFAFMFVASWAVLGVALAIKSAKVEIGGGITFTATDVYATISGSVTGTKSSNPIDEHPIEIDASTTEDFAVDSSWTNMNLDYQDANTPIVVTIKIENKSQERDLWLVIADNIEDYYSGYYLSEDQHNTDVTRKIDGVTQNTWNFRYTTMEVEKGSTKELEIILNIHSKSNSVDDNFNLSIELIDESSIKDKDDTPYSKLSFTTDDTTKTASVSAANKNISGEVVIPALISSGNEIYTVNRITDFNDCSQMTSISIPASITTMGIEYEDDFMGPSEKGAFLGCTSVNSVKLDGYVAWYCSGETYDLSPTLTSITFPLSYRDSLSHRRSGSRKI